MSETYKKKNPVLEVMVAPHVIVVRRYNGKRRYRFSAKNITNIMRYLKPAGYYVEFTCYSVTLDQ